MEGARWRPRRKPGPVRSRLAGCSPRPPRATAAAAAGRGRPRGRPAAPAGAEVARLQALEPPARRPPAHRGLAGARRPAPLAAPGPRRPSRAGGSGPPLTARRSGPRRGGPVRRRLPPRCPWCGSRRRRRRGGHPVAARQARGRGRPLVRGIDAPQRTVVELDAGGQRPPTGSHGAGRRAELEAARDRSQAAAAALPGAVAAARTPRPARRRRRRDELVGRARAPRRHAAHLHRPPRRPARLAGPAAGPARRHGGRARPPGWLAAQDCPVCGSAEHPRPAEARRRSDASTTRTAEADGRPPLRQRGWPASERLAALEAALAAPGGGRRRDTGRRAAGRQAATAAAPPGAGPAQPLPGAVRRPALDDVRREHEGWVRERVSLGPGRAPPPRPRGAGRRPSGCSDCGAALDGARATTRRSRHGGAAGAAGRRPGGARPPGRRPSTRSSEPGGRGASSAPSRPPRRAGRARSRTSRRAAAMTTRLARARRGLAAATTPRSRPWRSSWPSRRWPVARRLPGARPARRAGRRAPRRRLRRGLAGAAAAAAAARVRRLLRRADQARGHRCCSAARSPSEHRTGGRPVPAGRGQERRQPAADEPVGYVLAARLEQVAASAIGPAAADVLGPLQLVHTADGRPAAGPAAGCTCGCSTRGPASSATRRRLSGGETFSASLALALGLADVVTGRGGRRPAGDAVRRRGLRQPRRGHPRRGHGRAGRAARGRPDRRAS